MAARSDYLLKWEEGTRQVPLRDPLSDQFDDASGTPGKLSRAERENLARSLTFGDILRVTEFNENPETRRKHRWKALVNFYNISQRPEYRIHSIEKALWKQDGMIVSRDYFVTSLIAEFGFDASMYYDKQLHNLYLTFDGGKHDRVDWRDIMAHFQVLYYFRLVRGSALELIMLLFDIYSLGDTEGRSVTKDKHVLINACDYVRRIFLIPCILDAHITQMDTYLLDLMFDLRALGQRVKRKQFEVMLQQYEQPKLLDFWARIAWERLPLDMRLTVYDETQMLHKDRAEMVLMRHKLQQALALYHKNCMKPVFREWRLEMLRESGVRKYIHKRMYRKRDRFFRFWDALASRRRIKRRRRVLAEVMGQYSLKARAFARIKLFNYNNHRLLHIVGPTDRYARQTKLGGTHLREFSRLYRMRTFYHRWWNECVQQHNAELAEWHDWQRCVRRCFVPWHDYAHELAVERRMEALVRENQLRFERMMAEAQETADELTRLEEERKAKQAAEEAARLQREKEERLEKARQDRLRMKEEDRQLLLAVQQEERVNRIKRELRRMKKKFKEEWEEKTDILLAKAKDRITAYIENRDNKLAIDTRFEKVKANFFAPPTPETADRERILTSVKNICFLYVDAKLRSEMIQLKDLIPQFDKQSKGYLTYEEFRDLIKATGAGLTNAQISAVIRGVDADGDGNIDLGELEQSMKETEQMGVVGSPWKMYVDPAEDVICYHNFQTGERIFDYQIKDKKLREIAIADMYGEADAVAVREIHAKKEAEWEFLIRDYMARRIQYLYRRRRAMKWRQKKVFKILNRELKVKTRLQKNCVRFMERQFVGYKSREKFKKQLRLTFEKVWDVDSRRIFWFNYHTKESTWELPLLLRRYGDVTPPLQWVANPLPATDEDRAAQRFMERGKDIMKRSKEPLQLEKKTLYVIHYWHVEAQRQLPRKPDGLPLCAVCLRNLALHHCNTCSVDYCFACHRATHSSPFGFAQRTKLTKKQAKDQQLVERIYFFEHHVWTTAKPKRCQMCRSSKICAAFHCDTCEVDMCRNCSQRVHHPNIKKQHDFYSI